MSNKKRTVEKIADPIADEKSTKKNKSAVESKETSSSTSTSSRVFSSNQEKAFGGIFTNIQRERIDSFRTNSALPEFSINILTAENVTGVYRSTKPENLELFLKVLTATRSAPFCWPRIADLCVFKEIVFDVSNLLNVYPDSAETHGSRSLYALAYRRFYPLNVISNKIRYNITKENHDDTLTAKFMNVPRSDLFQTSYIFRNVAEIAQTYIERLEILDDAGQLKPMEYGPLETCLLIEPFDLLQDIHNRIYHLPCVDGITSLHMFVPGFVHTLKTRFERLRASLLISLARFVYAFYFGRVFDTDFNVSAKNFVDWKASVKAELFPFNNQYGSSASVFMIKWLIECMCNTIKTANITQHEVFTSPKTVMWRNVVSISSSVAISQRTRFYHLFDPLRRVNNKEVSVSIDLKTGPNSGTRLLYTSNYDKFTETEKKDCDLSLCVYSKILALLHDTEQPVYGYTLVFEYDGVSAQGIGVSREIVLRSFEGLKKWQAFVYREEKDMLECAFDEESFSSNRVLQKCVEFLFVLVYWSVVNDEAVPYMISPTLLHYMFGLRAHAVLAPAFDHLRVTMPLVANNILSINDDDSANLRDLGGESGDSALDVLSFYLRNDKNNKYNKALVHQCLKSINAHPVFRHFYTMIRELYDTSESLIFLITHRLYGSEMAVRDAVTNELAVALLKPENLNLTLRIEHEHLRMAYEVPTSLNGRPIVEYFLHHENRVKEIVYMPSFYFIEFAKQNTYIFLVRWLAEAQSEQIAKLWKILKGMPTIVHCQIADVKVPNLETIKTKLKLATELTSADKLCSQDTQLLATMSRLNTAMNELSGVHRSGNRNAINVSFRSASMEEKYQLAPHFASCSSTLSVSICHADYHSFSESMNLALSDSQAQFTMNT